MLALWTQSSGTQQLVRRGHPHVLTRLDAHFRARVGSNLLGVMEDADE